MSHQRGKVKVSYATRDDAVVVARRLLLKDGKRLVPYRCTYRGNEHWHLKTLVPRGRITRWHEEWNVELGARVVGCLAVENLKGWERRLMTIEQRARAAVERAEARAA